MHGKLRTRSHGEAFLALMYELATSGEAQFIIAAHSPILMTYPDADIFSFDGGSLHKVAYEDTDHYRTTHDFLNAPERFLRHLMPMPPMRG